MIKTGAEYQAAIVGSPRRIEILAVVDISDPDIVFGKALLDSLAPWSKPEELHDKNFDAPARYATLEPNRWLLDGSFDIFPDSYQVPEHVGVANDVLCGEDGTWPADHPAMVEQPFSNVRILQACSVFFSSDPLDGVPMDFTVEVLSGGVCYHSKQFTGNTETQIALTGFTVHTPDAIRVTCTKWSIPRRRLRVVEILPGIYEEWTPRMLATFKANLQGSFSAMALPVGSVDLEMDNRSRRFEPRSKTGVFQSIEERQGVEIYIGVRLPSGRVYRCQLGVFYQAGDGWQTGENDVTMRWHLVDIIGLLSDRTFILPDPLPKTLDGWTAAVVGQLGKNFSDRYHVDPNYAQLPVTASSPEAVRGKVCADILRWICQATGTWPRAAQGTGVLTVEPLWSQGNKLTLDNLERYPVMKANESIAAIIFRLADEQQSEYIVSGNSVSSRKTITVQNPFIHTQEQARTAARNILSTYGGNIIQTVGRGRCV